MLPSWRDLCQPADLCSLAPNFCLLEKQQMLPASPCMAPFSLLTEDHARNWTRGPCEKHRLSQSLMLTLKLSSLYAAIIPLTAELLNENKRAVAFFCIKQLCPSFFQHISAKFDPFLNGEPICAVQTKKKGLVETVCCWFKRQVESDVVCEDGAATVSLVS